MGQAWVAAEPGVGIIVAFDVYETIIVPGLACAEVGWELVKGWAGIYNDHSLASMDKIQWLQSALRRTTFCPASPVLHRALGVCAHAGVTKGGALNSANYPTFALPLAIIGVYLWCLAGTDRSPVSSATGLRTRNASQVQLTCGCMWVADCCLFAVCMNAAHSWRSRLQW